MRQDPAAATPWERYKKRTGAAGDILKSALRRNPDDTVAWDAHHRELQDARAELREADPAAVTGMLNASMDWSARNGTPAAEDTRTDAEKTEDAFYLR